MTEYLEILWERPDLTLEKWLRECAIASQRSAYFDKLTPTVIQCLRKRGLWDGD